MDNPTFSIVIPVYNPPVKYFDVCMGSILKQSFGRFEVVLSDDGSNPECAQLCDRYAAKDGRVKVLHHPNQGVSAARNLGIESATGQYVMFVDADDWLEPDACERLFKCLQDNPCEILMFSAIREYSDASKALFYGFEHARMYDMDDLAVREMVYRRMLGVKNTKQGKFSTVYYCWDKVYLRSFLMEHDLRFPVGVPKSEDKVFVCSCFEKAHSFLYIKDVLYHYRMEQSSACHKYSENADRDRLLLAEKLKEIADRMDREIGRLKSDPTYHEMNKELDRFIFGIISDILFLKYYHPSYKGGSRKAAAMQLLSREPFWSAIRNVPYNGLPLDAKLKKFLLSHGLVDVFFFLKKRTKRMTV